MFDLAIDLGHGFLAAHGEHGMAEADQNSDETDGVRKRCVAQPAKRAPMIASQVGYGRETRQRGEMRAFNPQRVTAPDHHDYNHGCGHVHDAQSFLAGFGNSLDVFPPEIKRHRDGEYRSAAIHGNDRAGV